MLFLLCVYVGGAAEGSFCLSFLLSCFDFVLVHIVRAMLCFVVVRVCVCCFCLGMVCVSFMCV